MYLDRGFMFILAAIVAVDVDVGITGTIFIIWEKRNGMPIHF